MGAVSVRVAREYIDAYAPDEEVLTTLDLERIRFRYNILAQGPTQVKSAWKLNELKPRVYYSKGPTAHNASRFIQQVFNTLIDLFPATNRYTRFSTAAIPDMDQDDTV